MSISVVDSNYSTRNHGTGNNFLLSSTRQIVTDYVDIVCEFDFQSSINEQILIVALNKIRILGGLWSNKGYVLGDTVHIYGTIVNGGITAPFTALALNVTAINGDTLTLSGSLDPSSTGIIVGQVMPSQAGSNSNTAMGILNTSRTAPETVELFHNLISNSSAGGTGSLFDGEVNKFNFEGVGASGLGGTSIGVQQGNKSGGSYISYELERLADVLATDWSFTVVNNVSYRITLVYANPLKFQDSDFLKPSWFDANNSLKPFYGFRAISEQNNPNSVLTQNYAGQLGNVGWRDESYNQGVNEFTVVSVAITDSSLNPLSEVDFSQSCILTATITHPSVNFLEAAEIEFNLIPDVETIKNQPDRHCDLIQLSNFFINSVPTITSQVFGTNGAEMQTSSESLNVATSNQIIVQFTLDPNLAFTTLINSMGSDTRRYVITATVESTGGNENDNNAVPLTLKQGILELAPIVGSPYPTREQSFFNHANLVTGTPDGTYRGCTEDDFLYKALFNLEQGEVWTGIDLKIQVVRDSDNSTFDLISKFVNLTNFIVNVDDEIQINYTEPITQYLESPDRNALSVSLTGNDVGTEYEVQILWSLMASWRYWIDQSNAFVDFFDGALPNNGMNAEWMRYLRLAGYSLRVRVNLIDDNNTAYFFGAGIDLQDYDDTPDVTTVFEYYDSSNIQQTSWVANDIMTIKAIHTLTSGTWDVNDTWGWNSVRPFQNEANKRISTVWDWTSQNNPLMPLTGDTKASLTFPTPDVAVVECRVNTAMISVETATAIGRIESPIDPVCVSPIDYLFDQVVASSDSELDYIEALEGFLINGIIAKNMCCPTCDVLNSETGLLDEVYIFGADITATNPLSPYTGATVCCTDSYGTLSGCSGTFDSDWDAFMLTLSGAGDTTALTALVPSQINTYANASMTMLIAKIQSVSSNLVIQYNLMFILLTKGFQAACINGGDKVISQINTINPSATFKVTTQGDFKVTTQGDFKTKT